MRQWLCAAAITVLVAPACLPEAARAQEADFSFFEEALTPYGEWVNLRGYGACWHPDVEEDWAPYTNGYWAYTDVGWTWVSHEPFGSIVFHYGRWLLTNGGWCWVPGSEWGPAWVSWRRGGEHVGWAPLPPEVPWHPQRGISGWVDVHTEIGPGYYRFCSARDFCAPNLTTVLVRPSRNLTIMLKTENVTNIWSRNNVVYCGGPEYRWVRERSEVEVPILRVARETNVQRYYSMNVGGNFGTVNNFVYDGKLVLPAPSRVEVAVSQRGRHLRSVETEVSRGWHEDGGDNGRLRSHLNQEWETRQVVLRRNPEAYGKAVLEVKVNPVSASERQGLVLDVVSRGGIAAPTSQRPQHPSYPQNRPGDLTAEPPMGKIPLKKPAGQKGAASIETPPFAEPGIRPSAVPKAVGTTGGAAGKAAGGGSIFNGDQPSEPPTPFGTKRPLPIPSKGGTTGPGEAKSLPFEPRAPSGNVSNTGGLRPLKGSSREPIGEPVTGGGTGLSPVAGGAPQSPRKRTESFPQPTSPGGTAEAPNGVPGGRPSPFSGKGGSGAPGNPTGAGNPTPGFSGAPSAQGVPPSPRQPGFPATQNSAPQRPNFGSGGSGPQQVPMSGARSTVIPAPQSVPQAPAPGQAPTVQKGFGGPPSQGGGGGGFPARGNAPAANSAPSGSAASLGTVPAGGTAQPGQKKKPGDPGYVPPQ